jgi:membrane protein
MNEAWKDVESGLTNTKQMLRFILLILRRAISSFDEARAAQASAGIAYYAFFSLFPLLLVLISAGSFFINSEEAVQTVLGFAGQILPGSTIVLEQNIIRVLRMRTSIGIIGLVILLWSATGVFSALAFNIDLAWQNTRRRNFIQKRLVGLAMVSVLAFLYLLFLILTITFRSLPAILGAYWDLAILRNREFLQAINFVSTWAVIFLLYFALYRWVPSTRVNWKPAAITAALSTLMWQAVLHAFSWFIQMGLDRYELVYGTLGTIVALLLSIYLYAWIALFGAHLCASIRIKE